MENTKIKICGLTTTEDIEAVNKYKPEYVGFVLFFPKSKRNLQIEAAKELISLLDNATKKVAVVVSPNLEQVEKISESGFDYIQIHGALPEGIEKCKLPVIKAFNVSDMNQLEKMQKLPFIEGFVFDASTPGSGQTFDWSILEEIEKNDKLFVLSGGLSPDNVAEAIEKVNPDVVDVSSGVEYSDKKGKDPMKIAAFIDAVRI